MAVATTVSIYESMLAEMDIAARIGVPSGFSMQLSLDDKIDSAGFEA